MRPKFAIALLLPALLFLGAIILFKQHSANVSKPAAAPAPATTGVAPASEPESAPATTSVAPALQPALEPVVAKAMTPEERQAEVDAEKDRLFDWGMSDDPQSLSHILGDLTNSEKEVRLAAIEATKQFGSKDAIPALKEQAQNTGDAEEQTGLLKAAEFLSLTPMSDSSVQLPKTPEQIQAEQQKIKQAEARKKSRLEAQSQNPQPVSN